MYAPTPAPYASGYAVGAAPPLNMSVISDVQHALNLFAPNAPSLSVDGIMGETTRDALLSFQQTVYLRPTGQLDPDTRGMLVQAMKSIGVSAVTGSAQRTATGAAPMVTLSSVLDMQRALNLLMGRNVGPALIGVNTQLVEDGVLGHDTRAAIVAFQKAYMLPPTGDVDHETRKLVAESLGQIGITAYVPTAVAGAAPTAPPNRAEQSKNQTPAALWELREIGVTAVTENLRHVVAAPSLDTMQGAINFLAMPSAGAFANQVAALWRSTIDWYTKQADPNGAFVTTAQPQLATLLAQLDSVLGAINQLAASPTVDNLSSTIALLSSPQTGPLGPKVANAMRDVLNAMTSAPT